MSLDKAGRDRIAELKEKWDAIIIGGGITGAGIFRDMAVMGYRVLLLEQTDFAFGTSSRSSKLVHGGLRYLANGQFNVTRESVQEREHLQKQYPYLVKPLEFILPVYDRYKYNPSFFEFGIAIYDLFGKKWRHGKYSAQERKQKFHELDADGLRSSLYYFDAEVDDARLVWRVIHEGSLAGGIALNYCRVEKILKDHKGSVSALQVRDLTNQQEIEIPASLVINATGPWTDELRSQMIDEKVIRKLRGSHILFERERVPVQQAFTIFHPVDGRALFVIPWQGMTMVGTTDLDHPEVFEREKPEPFMTAKEMDYLLEAVNTLFPDTDVSEKDIVSSFAGLRPIVSMGAMDPSKASRTHKIFEEGNLFSIAGGKLTTFERMSSDMLKRIASRLPKRTVNKFIVPDASLSVIKISVSVDLQERLSGILGPALPDFLAEISQSELTPLASSPFTLGEIRWATRHEMIHHLSDLMLRRTRLGLVCAEGGAALLPQIKPIVQQELSWSDNEWEQEQSDYLHLWHECYSIPQV